jgi:hypothetical protein
MQCYSLRGGQLAGVDMLPRGPFGPSGARESRDPVFKAQGFHRRLRGVGSGPLDLQASGTAWTGPRADSPMVGSGEGGQSSAARKSSREAIMARRPLPRYSPGP